MKSGDFSTTNTQLYSQFIHKSRYARWLDTEKRRESWDETVDRYLSFFIKKFPEQEQDILALRDSILDCETMPSMRCLMTAGKALDRDNVAGFNCSYLTIDHPRAFDELMYILMCGTGAGFSVERQYVTKLPDVAEHFEATSTNIVVHDSKIGWAKAYKELISLLYVGQVPTWDLSQVRPSGAKLKTFGGRASGPAPLDDLFCFTVAMFKKAQGRKLTSIECHDLCCKIAEIVVVGGVRRSALISLSNPSDDRMRVAKSGQWWESNAQRALANNSASYTERPDFDTFLKEWLSLYESKSGERGVFSRKASKKQAEKTGRRDSSFDFGTNPCSEIILRPNQFCNLSEVIVRADDTIESLIKKVRVATALGTLQSSLTDFRYLRSVWKRNTEEECLLGVSMTGIMDHKVLGNPDSKELPETLEILKQAAIEENKIWAAKIGVNPSTSITCVKPSGTVSQLTNTASGIHPRYARHYIRRVRADIKDPLTQFMKDRDFPNEVDVMNKNNLIFSFPIEAPEDGTVVKDVGAMHQLKLWKIYQDHWCEHKPSITVYYTDSEFMEIGNWLWNNFDDVSGISFLPHSEHSYRQAPYEEITKEVYDELLSKMPKGISWEDLAFYENDDNTSGSQQLACSSGVCEIVDIGKSTEVSAAPVLEE